MRFPTIARYVKYLVVFSKITGNLAEISFYILLFSPYSVEFPSEVGCFL